MDFVSTAPEFRNRGFARAEFLAALAVAEQEECDRALLQATMIGRHLYLSLGFEEFGRLSIRTDTPPNN